MSGKHPGLAEELCKQMAVRGCVGAEQGRPSAAHLARCLPRASSHARHKARGSRTSTLT